MGKETKKILFFTALALFSVVARFLPHPPNFAPIGALSVAAGLNLKWRFAALFPLAAMAASDLFLGFYNPAIMFAVYGSFILYFGLAHLFKGGRFGVVWACLSGSVSFFVITNFAVWAFSSMYSKNISGLIASYGLAVPFFRNTILGDLFYAGVFLLAYEAFMSMEISRIALKKKVFALSGIFNLFK